MATATELAQLDDDELANRLAEYRRELLNLRFQLATSQLDNPARVSEARRDVARVLTLMRDREIALAEGREVGPFAQIPPRPVRRRAVEVDDEDIDTEAGGEIDEAEALDSEEDVEDVVDLEDSELEPDEEDEEGEDR